MYVANTHLKPVIGIDIHFVNTPIPFVPLPHPYIGLVIDPFDYIPFIGATVMVNGVPRGNCTTMGMIITFTHIPFGLGFTLMPMIGHDSQNFFGSKRVIVDGAPMSGAGYMLMTCNDIGLPLTVKPGHKFIPIPSLYLPTSFCIPLQWGPPVMVGGPLVPNFSLLALLKAYVFGCFLKIAGKLGSKLLKKLKGKSSLSSKASAKASKGKDCGDPVDVVSGRVTYEYTDFELPGPIPLQWQRVWDSDSDLTGILGHGTHLCYDRYVTLYPKDSYLTMLLADGREATFPYLQPGEEFYHPEEKMQLRRKQNGHFILDDFRASLYYHFNQQTDVSTFHLSFIENYSGHRIQLHYQRNKLFGITDSAGRKIRLHTNQQGSITQVEIEHRDAKQILVSYAYNETGDMVTVADALGQATQLVFENHLMVQKTDRNGASFYWEYDSQQRCIHTWGKEGLLEYFIEFYNGYTIITNSLSEQTTYWYDENNLIVQETDHYGNNRYTEYTEDLDLYRQIDEQGNITGYLYDDQARLTEKILPDGATIKYQYNDYHQPVLIIYPDGNSETYGYDDARRLRFINYPNGQTLSYEYNEEEQLTAVIENGVHQTSFSYDDDSNLIQAILPGNVTAGWKYDALGRCIQAVNAEGQLRQFHYDALGRVRNMYLPDGNKIELEYNAYEEVTAATDKHSQIQFEYTALGSIKKRKQASNEVSFIYDTEERLRTIVNEGGNHYRFGYNKRGEIISESGFDDLQRTYQRDAAGKVIKTERPGNRYTRYEYDSNGRIIRAEYHDGSWELFRYDKNGNLTEATNEASQVKLVRNKLGAITTEWQDDYSINSSYDKYGNRTGIHSSLGADIQMQRNELGQVTNMQAAVNELLWNCQIKYNKAGQEVEKLMPGNLKSERSYDHAGRPAEQKLSSNGVVQSWKKYTWDSNDRLTHVFETLQKSGTRFKHDAVGNLVWAQYADNSILHRQADATGNLYETSDKSDRRYGPGGKLLESKKYLYKYDEEGNLTSNWDKQTGKKWQYGWYANGMLQKVVRPDGREVTFKYDALGRRTEKCFSSPIGGSRKGAVTRWVWDGNVPLHQWQYPEQQRPKPVVDEYGGISYDKPEPIDQLTTWVFDADSFRPTVKISNGQTQSIVCDYLGTPQELYDEQGAKVWEGTLDIYGRTVTLKGSRSDCPFRYQGQYEDMETGLYYNRFRYYAPEEGMYISQDPIRLAGGKELYKYVRDTNKWVDPFGLSECSKKDLIAFGNKEKPRNPRVSDFEGVMDENGIIKSQASSEWPKGASTFAKPEQTTLSGHYHTIKEGTPLPEGMAIKADGRDVGGPNSPGHHTIYNTREMSHSEFTEKFNEIEKTYGGKQ